MNAKIIDLRVGNTVQHKESGDEVRLTTPQLVIIENYEGLVGTPYEYKEVTEDWLERKGFRKVCDEDDIYNLEETDFYIIKTTAGYMYLTNYITREVRGIARTYCHEIENLYWGLYRESAK